MKLFLVTTRWLHLYINPLIYNHHNPPRYIFASILLSRFSGQRRLYNEGIEHFGRQWFVVNVWLFKIVVLIRVVPRVTNAHWVNILQFFTFTTCWLQLHINPLIYKHQNQTRHILEVYCYQSFLDTYRCTIKVQKVL